jgi:hypothetical protein
VRGNRRENYENEPQVLQKHTKKKASFWEKNILVIFIKYSAE